VNFLIKKNKLKVTRIIQIYIQQNLLT